MLTRKYRALPYFHNKYAGAWTELVRLALVTANVGLGSLFLSLVVLLYATPLDRIVPASWATPFNVVRLSVSLWPVSLLAGLWDGLRKNRMSFAKTPLASARDSVFQPGYILFVLIASLFVVPPSFSRPTIASMLRNLLVIQVLLRLLPPPRYRRYAYDSLMRLLKKVAIAIFGAALPFLIPLRFALICADQASRTGAVLRRHGWGPWLPDEREAYAHDNDDD